MKLAILTCGILPIPAVQGGAVENLIDFYLEYNNKNKLHDITVYSPLNPVAIKHPSLTSEVNHYVFIDVISLKARIKRRIYKYFHTSREYYNHFIEYYFEKVYADLKRKKYDYILLENCPGYAYKLSQRGYKNLVLHLHNNLLNSISRYHDEISSSLVKVLTVSEYIKKQVSTIVPSIKVQTIHNGIDLDRFSTKRNASIQRREIGFSEDDFIMVYSGRINQEKGVSELIDAVLKLNDTPRIKLLIIGGTFFGNAGDEDDYVRALKEKAVRIKERIVFTGFIAYENMPDYLRLADIAVIPSIWNDPFPTTVLEAQAMGLPIITTVRGGIPEEVSPENAILLETDEHIVDNLAKSILELYQNPERRKRMSQVALERAGQFGKEIYAEKFFAALKGL